MSFSRTDRWWPGLRRRYRESRKEWGCRGVRAYGVWGGLRRAARTRMSRAGWRLRTRWRSVLSRGARLTGATVAAFVAAELVGLRDPPPLIAALTALLVVEATLASTFVSGLQRVLSVVAGVALAVVLASIVGLTWWSLGALVAASIVVGQLLRLGPHLLEVPISAMLVLGVGHAAGAESVASGRIMETVVGAIAGVLVNVAFPPPVATRDASRAVTAFAKEIAALLSVAAEALEGGPIPGDLAAQWLEDARRLTRHAPRVERVLAHAEQSRRLNLRALRHPPQGGLRSSLEALEHTSISVRTLFRAMHDATQRRTGVQDDPDYATHVRCSAAVLMADMARVLWAFGRCAHGRAAGTAEQQHVELASALASLRRRRDGLEDVLIGDPRSRQGLWELNSALLTTVDRMLLELDAATITVDPDQRRTRQALGRLRAAVHDATHRPDREAHPAKDRPNRPNTRNPIRHVVRRCPSQASDGASAAHWGDAAGRPRRPSHPHACTTFHALTDRALVAAVAWKYIAYNQPATSSHPNATGLASTRAELASLNELILTGSGGNGALVHCLITTSRLPD